MSEKQEKKPSQKVIFAHSLLKSMGADKKFVFAEEVWEKFQAELKANGFATINALRSTFAILKKHGLGIGEKRAYKDKILTAYKVY